MNRRQHKDLPEWRMSESMVSTKKYNKTTSLQEFFTHQNEEASQQQQKVFGFLESEVPQEINTTKLEHILAQKKNRYSDNHMAYREKVMKMKITESKTKLMTTQDILLFSQKYIDDSNFQISIQNMFRKDLESYDKFLNDYKSSFNSQMREIRRQFNENIDNLTTGIGKLI